MRIDGTTRRSSVSQRKSSSKAGKSGATFQPAVSSPVAGSASGGSAVPVSAASGIEAILALQGVDNSMEKKRQAVRHGQSMLDALEEMKADLLSGAIPEGRLNRLMALVTRARQQADPELEALIDDIDLRARVELAKMGRFVQ